MAAPKCFISYSWDNDEHKDWVRCLATELQRNGVETRLDQWDTHPGMDVTNYMETCIRESDFVLLVCTPIFAQKANVGLGGVGYEKGIVTGEIFADAASPKKFVPLLRKGNPRDSLPSYLKSRVYIDFKVTEGTKLYRDLFKRYKTWRGVRNSYVDSLLYIGGHADRALNMLLKVPETVVPNTPTSEYIYTL